MVLVMVNGHYHHDKQFCSRVIYTIHSDCNCPHHFFEKGLLCNNIMEHIDHIAARVSLSALLGGLGGSIYSSLRGLPLASTSLKIAASTAMVGTALFTCERAAFVVMDMENHRQRVWTTHAFAGVAGGALNGFLYQKKPLRGMFYFVPVMMGVAAMELSWERQKEQRRASLEKSRQPNLS